MPRSFRLLGGGFRSIGKLEANHRVNLQTSVSTTPIINALNLSGTPGALTQNVPFSFTPVRVGGTGTVTFSIAAGTLPAGTALNPSTGVISGTPTATGSSTVTLHAVDSATPIAITADLILTLVVSPALTITGTPSDGTAGVAYSFAPTASGGRGTKVFTLTGTLPDGLAFDGSTGEISGTPTTAGTTFGLDISVHDADGRTASLLPFTITVASTATGSPTTLDPSTKSARIDLDAANLTATGNSSVGDGTSGHVLSIGAIAQGTKGGFEFTPAQDGGAGVMAVGFAIASIPADAWIGAGSQAYGAGFYDDSHTWAYQDGVEGNQAGLIWASGVPLRLEADLSNPAAPVCYFMQGAVRKGPFPLPPNEDVYAFVGIDVSGVSGTCNFGQEASAFTPTSGFEAFPGGYTPADSGTGGGGGGGGGGGVDTGGGRGNNGTGTIPEGAISVNTSTWYSAMLAAAPGTVLALEPGDYGQFSVYNVHKAAPGVLFYGQDGVRMQSIAFTQCDGLGVAYADIYGSYSNGAGATVQGVGDRIVFDHLTIPFIGLDTDGSYQGSGIFINGGSNVTITNCDITERATGISLFNVQGTANLVQGNRVKKLSVDAFIVNACSNVTLRQNFIAELDVLPAGDHPDTIQLGATGGPRLNNILIEYNNFDWTAGRTDLQGISLAEHGDNIVIQRNCCFGSQTNGCSIGDMTNVTVQDNFWQAWAETTQVRVRDGSSNVQVLRNQAPLFQIIDTDKKADGVTPNPTSNVTMPFSGADANTVIPNATGPTDTALRDAFLAANPLIPTS